MVKTKTKKDFSEGPIYLISSYIIWLFLGNLYFLLVNLPLVYLLFSILLNGVNKLPTGFSIVFFLCCIPIGPGITALFSVMGKLVREKNVSITKDFFIAYKMNFPQAIFFWNIGIIIIGIISVYIRYLIVNNYPLILTIILYTVIAIIIILWLYILPIVSRFYLKTMDVIKFSSYYTIKKFYITFLNLLFIIVIGFFIIKISPLMLFFFSSIICFLIMYNEKKILLEIEEKLETK